MSKLQSESSTKPDYERYGNNPADDEAVHVEHLEVNVDEAAENNDDVYEEYNQNHNGERREYASYSKPPSIVQKIMKKKFLVLFILSLITIKGLVVGLSVHFTKPSSHSSQTNATTITSATIYTTTTSTMPLSTTSESTVKEALIMFGTFLAGLAFGLSTPTILSISKAVVEPAEAILMLSTTSTRNVPMVIRLNGEVDDDINFTYDSNTEVYRSCSATLNGEKFVLGGRNQSNKNAGPRQMSKVQNCHLASVGELPFDFDTGACSTFSFGIMLCFGMLVDKECYSFNGVSFKAEPSSQFSHRVVSRLGVYGKSPFVTGSYNAPNGLTTEILDYEIGEWVQYDDYPFSNSDRLSYYATANTEESVFIIGGYTAGSPSRISTIAQFKDGIWKNAGSLMQARANHGAISLEGITMILGGSPISERSTETELWSFSSLETGIFNLTLGYANGFGEYSHGIGLFIVQTGFCSKNSSLIK